MSNPCFYRNDQLVSFESFFRDIEVSRKCINQHPCLNVMLFHSDSYQFTVLLFAFILEGKHVCLPPNKQVGTLQNIAHLCDATAGDIRLENKPHIEATQLTNTIDAFACDVSPKQLFTMFSCVRSGQLTFFTSGSTGQPKAVVKRCQQLTSELEILSELFSKQLSQSDIFVSTVSHQHIYGLLFKILLPLRLGKIIVSQTFEYPEHINTQLMSTIFDSSLKTTKHIVLVSGPAHIKRLILDNVLAVYSEYYFATFSSGGLLSMEASQLYSNQMRHQPIEVYGSTETGGIAWRCGQPKPVTPWQVFPKIKYQTDHITGRLAIFSPFVDGSPYVTDDNVETIDSTSFILKGRVDRTVKIEEKRVNLNHIEQNLLAHPWVVDAKVLVVSVNKAVVARNIITCALIVTKEANDLIQSQGKRALNDELKQYLLAEFEPICLPKKWRYLDKFPCNSQGKLVLDELESLFD